MPQPWMALSCVLVAAGVPGPAASVAQAGGIEAATPSAPTDDTDLAALLGQADGWLLAGRTAPPELPRLLQALAPADRLMALSYLRRSGVYDGPPLDLAALLQAGATP